ncbi:MAG: AI-2E family transporter [Betaproteobacteria bacterium]
MAAKHDNLLTRERILAFVLVAVSVLVGWLVWLLVKPFVPALTWAVVWAVIAHPWHERLLRRMPAWPNAAAALAVVAVTVILAVPAALLAREVGKEAIASADSLRNLMDGERWNRAINQFPSLAPLREWVDREVDVKGQVKQASGGVAKGVQDAVANGVELAVTVMITFFLLFFFLRDKWRILGALQHLVPLAAVETAQVTHKVRDMIAAVVYGTLVVAVVQGTLGGLMFWWLGLPAPLLWGSMMALLAVLPILGAAVVWLPATLFLLLDGHWEKALVLFLWGSIVIGLIDNFLYPVLMKNRLQMHTVPIFIGAMGGLFAFGTTGIVLGPLILAVAIALIDIWRRRMELREIVTGVNDNTPR